MRKIIRRFGWLLGLGFWLTLDIHGAITVSGSKTFSSAAGVNGFDHAILLKPEIFVNNKNDIGIKGEATNGKILVEIFELIKSSAERKKIMGFYIAQMTSSSTSSGNPRVFEHINTSDNWSEVLMEGQSSVESKEVEIVITISNATLHEVYIPGLGGVANAKAIKAEDIHLQVKVHLNGTLKGTYGYNEEYHNAIPATMGDRITYEVVPPFASFRSDPITNWGNHLEIQGVPGVWQAYFAGEVLYYCTSDVQPGEYRPWLGFDTRADGTLIRKYPSDFKLKEEDWSYESGKKAFTWEHTCQRRMDYYKDTYEPEFLWEKTTSFYELFIPLPKGPLPLVEGTIVERRGRDLLRLLTPLSSGIGMVDSTLITERKSKREGLTMGLLKSGNEWENSITVDPFYVPGIDDNEQILLEPSDDTTYVLQTTNSFWKQVPPLENKDPILDVLEAYRINRTSVLGGSWPPKEYKGYEIQDRGTSRSEPFGKGIGNNKHPGTIRIAWKSQSNVTEQVALHFDVQAPFTWDRGFYHMIEGCAWPVIGESVPYTLKGLIPGELEKYSMALEYENDSGTRDVQSFSLKNLSETEKQKISESGEWTVNFKIKGSGYNAVTAYYKSDGNYPSVAIAGKEIFETTLEFIDANSTVHRRTDINKGDTIQFLFANSSDYFAKLNLSDRMLAKYRQSVPAPDEIKYYLRAIHLNPFYVSEQGYIGKGYGATYTFEKEGYFEINAEYRKFSTSIIFIRVNGPYLKDSIIHIRDLTTEEKKWLEITSLGEEYKVLGLKEQIRWYLTRPEQLPSQTNRYFNLSKPVLTQFAWTVEDPTKWDTEILKHDPMTIKYIDKYEAKWMPTNRVLYFSNRGSSLPIPGDYTSSLNSENVKTYLGNLFKASPPEPWQIILPRTMILNIGGVKLLDDFRCIYKIDEMFNHQHGAFSGNPKTEQRNEYPLFEDDKRERRFYLALKQQSTMIINTEDLLVLNKIFTLNQMVDAESERFVPLKNILPMESFKLKNREKYKLINHVAFPDDHYKIKETPIFVPLEQNQEVISDSGKNIHRSPPLNPVDDSFKVADGSIRLDVLENDKIWGPTNTLVITTNSLIHQDVGTLLLSPGSNFFYFVPESDFNGIETFTYTVLDTNKVGHMVRVILDCRPLQPIRPIDDDFTVVFGKTQILDVLEDDGKTEAGSLYIITPPQYGTARVVDNKIQYVSTHTVKVVDRLQYQALNAEGNYLYTAWVTIKLIPADRVIATLVTHPDTITLQQDKHAVIDVLSNEQNNVNSLTIKSISTQPQHGTVSIIEGKKVRYTPHAGYVGKDSFTYVAQNEKGTLSKSTLVQVTVTSINNQAPKTLSDYVTVRVTREDKPIYIDPTYNDEDPEGGTLKLDSLYGLFRDYFNTDGVSVENNLLKIEPSKYKYIDSFYYTVKDEQNKVSAKTLFEIEWEKYPDESSQARPDKVRVLQNRPQWIDVLDNDITPSHTRRIDPDTLTQPQHGTISVIGKQIWYIPHADYKGKDHFEYTLLYPGEPDSRAIVDIDVFKRTPDPRPDRSVLQAGGNKLISVLDNDTGSSLSVESIGSHPGQGTVAIEGNKIRYFSTNATFTGYDYFSYVVKDGFNRKESTYVEIKTESFSPNRAPRSYLGASKKYVLYLSQQAKQPYYINGNYSLNIDDDGDYIFYELKEPLFHVYFYNQSPMIAKRWENRIRVIDIEGQNFIKIFPTEGRLKLSDPFMEDLMYYLKDEREIKSASLTYQALLHVHHTVREGSPVNDDYTLRKNQVMVLDILKNDVNASRAFPQALLPHLVGHPEFGERKILPNGKVLYLPPYNFKGKDSFTYRIQNQLDADYSDEAIVTLYVGSNSDPVANDDTFAAYARTVKILGILQNDTDADRDPLEIVELSALSPNKGRLTLQANGTLVEYEAPSDYAGEVTFTYKAKDNFDALSAPATVTLIIPNVNNDPPVALPDQITGLKNHTCWIPVADNDYDPNKDPFFIARIDEAPKHGKASMKGKLIKFVPTTNYTGEDALTYTIKDEKGLASTSPSRVLINIVSENIPPVANDDLFHINEDEELDLNLVLNDFDYDTNDFILIHSVVSITNATYIISEDKTTLQYLPKLNYNGTNTFTYYAMDHKGEKSESPAKVTVVIHPVNDPPVATKDEISSLLAQNHLIGSIENAIRKDFRTESILLTSEGFVIKPLLNDYDPDGDEIYLDGMNTECRGNYTMFGGVKPYSSPLKDNNDYHNKDLFFSIMENNGYFNWRNPKYYWYVFKNIRKNDASDFGRNIIRVIYRIRDKHGAEACGEILLDPNKAHSTHLNNLHQL